MDILKKYDLLAAAKQLCNLMYEWNVVDVHELVVDDPRNGGSVYHHTTKALERILGHLGAERDLDVLRTGHPGGEPRGGTGGSPEAPGRAGALTC